jgi:hypothetical protein
MVDVVHFVPRSKTTPVTVATPKPDVWSAIDDALSRVVRIDIDALYAAIELLDEASQHLAALGRNRVELAHLILTLGRAIKLVTEVEEKTSNLFLRKPADWVKANLAISAEG